MIDYVNCSSSYNNDLFVNQKTAFSQNKFATPLVIPTNTESFFAFFATFFASNGKNLVFLKKF